MESQAAAVVESPAAPTPTVGRQLHYYPDRDHPLFDRAPLPGTVAMVHGCGNRVNLCVIDPNGSTFGVIGVPLVESGCGGDGESVEVDTEKHRCEWPPFSADATDAQRNSGLLLSIEDIQPELLERLEHELGKRVSSKMTEQISKLKTDCEEVANLRFDAIRQEFIKEFFPRDELQNEIQKMLEAEPPNPVENEPGPVAAEQPQPQAEHEQELQPSLSPATET